MSLYTSKFLQLVIINKDFLLKFRIKVTVGDIAILFYFICDARYTFPNN